MKYLYISKTVLIVSILVGMVSFSIQLQHWLNPSSKLFFEMVSTNGTEGEVYVDAGNGYLPEGRKRFSIAPDGKTHSYSIDVESPFPSSIRIDPGEQKSNFQIRRIKYENGLFSRTVECSELRLLHNIIASENQMNECAYEAVGEDPYLDFVVLSAKTLDTLEIQWSGIFENLFQILVKSIGFGIVAFLLLVIVDRIKVTDTEEKWLTTTRSVKFYVWIAIGFGLFVVFDLHVSSIDMWRHYIPTEVQGNVFFGNAQAIRSDEWLVQTPYYASQVLNNFAVHNFSLGANGVTLTAGVPVEGFYGYIQPRFWGFYLFGFEKGLSWLYAWRIFGVLLAFFIFFSIITKGDFWLALIGSFWIFFSPFVQWWFTTNLPDMLIAFAAGVSSVYLLTIARSWITLVMAATVLYFAGITFITALYPAFLVPLFYSALFIVVGLIIRDRLDKQFLKYWQWKTFVLLFVISLVLWVFVKWYMDAQGTIELIQNSVYPGKRVSVGGGFPVENLFSGYYSPFLSANQFPQALGNVCEASNFLLMFPMAWIVMITWFYYRKQFDPLLLSLSLYILLMLIWIIIGYPEWIANATKMSMSPPNRSLIGLGVASIILSIATFSLLFQHQQKRDNLIKTEKANIFLFFGLLIAFTGVSFWLSKSFPDFVTPWRMVVMTIALSVWSLAFINGWRKLLFLLTGLLLLNGFTVNPVTKGTTVMHDEKLASVLAEDKEKKETKWLVLGDIAHPQYFKAHGANVWNGVKFMPDPSEMRIIDPAEKHRSKWYRYAHTVVEPLPKGSPAEFELKQTDLVVIKIDVCSKGIEKLGINRFGFLSPVDSSTGSCLSPLREEPIAGLWLYQRKEK